MSPGTVSGWNREHYWHEGWRGGEMRARQGETDG